ncbi:Stage V sporulation protein D [bacterium HR20]|nr:Stage V sporulation protein D [bacterium HR20]
MSIEQLLSYRPQQLRWRRRLVVMAMAVGMLALIVRLLMVQIFDRAEWLARAEQQYRARIRTSGQRGAIRDRNGIELATSVGAVSLALDPKIARAPERVAALLEQLGHARAEEIRARIAAAQDRNFVWLARGLPLPVAAAFDTLGEPGLIRIREYRREYVHDWMAAALVGTTDVDGRGIAGIELAYDSLLQGSVGERIMERIGRGRLRPTLGDGSEQHARPGRAIELTLDWDVQQIAETELARSVSATGAAAGIVLVLRPQTGEIIACAQQPAFMHSQRSSGDGVRLRAVSDMYEPGSTFKAIVAAAALAEHRASPDQLFDGHGGVFRLPDGRAITDHTPLGTCTLADALAHSSNIVFAQLAERLGARTLYRYARDFGIGIRTDVGLPGEARGVLKLPRELRGSDLLFLGFGYGVACTPLQLACAYGAIANGGVLMQPFVVRRIISPDGEELVRAVPQRRRRVISDSVARVLRQLLAGVVERGTGTNARIEGVPVAGKTGTAQQWSQGSYSKSDYTASFVGMVPADSPSLVVLVMLDRPRTDIYGGSTAAPLFRRIVEAMMSIPNLAMRYSFFQQRKVTSVTNQVMVPDVRGMSTAHAKRILDVLHLRCPIVGNKHTIVVSQKPLPGTVIESYSTVMLDVAMPDTLKQLPLIGLPLRNAISLAHALNEPIELHGSGRVRSYQRVIRTRRHLILYAE